MNRNCIKINTYSVGTPFFIHVHRKQVTGKYDNAHITINKAVSADSNSFTHQEEK